MFSLKNTIGFVLLAHLLAFSLFHVRIQSSYPVSAHPPCQTAFLGAILDDFSFKVISLGGIPSKKTAKSWMPGEILIPEPLFAGRGDFHRMPSLLHWVSSEWNWPQEMDEKTSVRPVDLNALFLKADETPFVSLEGEVKRRTVLVRPSFSDSFKNPEGLPDFFRMTFGFDVSEEGIVEKVRPLLVSGNTELDQQGMNYLRQWRFVAGSSRQQGLLKINFSRSSL